MNIQSLVDWGNTPEYILQGMWFIEVFDAQLGTKGNTVISSRYFTEDLPIDKYIEDVNIPQLNLSYEKTDYDMINFSEKANFSQVTMTFSDNVNPPTCLPFFQDWTESIFDKKKNCVKNNWRYEKKDIKVTFVRIFKKKDGILRSILKDVVGNLANIGGSIIPRGVDTSQIEVKTVAEYMLKGCYPIGISEISVDTQGGDRMEFSVELEIEQVEPLFGNRTLTRIT